MSHLRIHRRLVPSQDLIRYLRSQCEAKVPTRIEPLFPLTCVNRPGDVEQRRYLSNTHRLQKGDSHCHRGHEQRRYLSRTHKVQSGSPRSYIDDLFARNQQKCKALVPAPRNSSRSNPISNRNASTDTSPEQRNESWWTRFWQRRQARKGGSTGRPNLDPLYSNGGSYEETSAQLFNLSRALSRSTSGAELKLRCTEFDENGSVTLVSGEFKKSELIAKYGLLPRDLRKIDSSILPHILVRPTSILINLLHLRVLIQSDRVLVFDAYGSTDSYTQSLFMYDLEGKLRQKSSPKDSSYLPYEFRALEAVLISVTSGLEAEFALVRDPVTRIVAELEDDIDREKLRRLLIHSKKLATFEQKARLVRDALDELLEADDDLSAMYLTEKKKTGQARAEDSHGEIEMLLESYHKICDEIVEISGNLISSVSATETTVRAILDSNRNSLMLFEIKVSIATLGLAGGTLMAGWYGQNLENFIEETNWGFGAVTAASLILSGAICMAGLRRLRKVQKVRMSGEGFDSIGYRGYGGRHALSRGNRRPEGNELPHMNERDLNRALGRQDGSGRVLWPDMNGLGIHKLNPSGGSVSANDFEQARTLGTDFSEPTNSDADDISPPTSGQPSSIYREARSAFKYPYAGKSDSNMDPQGTRKR